MDNELEIKHTMTNLDKKEVLLVKTIDYLSKQGYVMNRTKLLKLSVIQMMKHCYDNAVMLNDAHVSNLSNIVINI